MLGGAAMAVAAAGVGGCAKRETDAAPAPNPAPNSPAPSPSTGPKPPAAVGIPRRETYTFPRDAEALVRGMQEAGLPIVLGPNSVPAPAGISEQAKRAWANQSQVPLPADDPTKLSAVRQFAARVDDDAQAAMAATHVLEDRTVNGITTLRVSPRELRHPDKALMFIHGGAWVINSRKTQLPLQCALADALGVPVISVEYRLAPEHPYPAALDDLVAAYTGLIEEVRPENLAVYGISAGGGLTLATLLRLKAEGRPLPTAAAVLCPGADMTHSGYLFAAVGLDDPVLNPYDIDLCMRGYVGAANPTDPLVSPVFGDYTGYPPLFVLASTAEIIGSDGMRVAQSARAAGVEVTLVVSDGMWHVPIADGTGIPEVQQAYDQLQAFLRRQLRTG